MPDTVEKATITNLVTGETVECQYNPTEYTLSKTNNWTVKTNKGGNVGNTEFGGGQPATLKLQLFFNTTETGDDVRDQTQKLWDMMMVNSQNIHRKTKKGEPPQCRFGWGSGEFFTAVIKSITQKFTMFLSNGRPVRATLDVTFQQYKDEKVFDPQNPTSRSEARKIWVVTEGQSLDWIAYQEYGDPAQWRYIAEINDLPNPRKLRAGQVLKLVPLP